MRLANLIHTNANYIITDEFLEILDSKNSCNFELCFINIHASDFSYMNHAKRTIDFPALNQHDFNNSSLFEKNRKIGKPIFGFLFICISLQF